MKLILALLLMQGVAAASVREIVTRLRHVKCDEICVDVSPAVSADLTALKHALRDLIADTVRDGVNVAPEELQARVIGQLEREDVPVGEVGSFGVIEKIGIERPKEYSGWLIATTRLAIPYGDDGSLYIFQVQDGSWKLALELEANGYSKIQKALGWLSYRIGLTADRKSPFLVATAVSPSNMSVWQGLTLEVVRVGAAPHKPVALVSRVLGYCLDQPYEIAIEPGGFGLLYLGWAVGDALPGSRGVHYVKYAVKDRSASIVKEAAADPGAVLNGCWGPTLIKQETVEEHEELFAVATCEATPQYAMLRVDSNGLHAGPISKGRPALSDDMVGEAIYFSGVNGVPEPELVSRVDPVLPAGYAGLDRTVRLSLVVNTDGSVDTISVPDWPDKPGLVIPAIRAIRQWKFKPGSTKVTTTVDVRFQN